MRECWMNVYDFKVRGVPWLGNPSRSRAEADVNALGVFQTALPGDLRAAGVACRIHVKLKPEGAPKRYGCDENRRAWEEQPVRCRFLVSLYGIPAKAIGVP